MEQAYFKSKIEELRGKLKLNRTHSPFIVEFTGLPKSGKTTIVNRLENLLDTHKLRVHVIEEAATEKVDSKHRSDLFVFNMLCALENLNGVLRASTMRGTFDVVLMDRGVYDSIVWCAFLERSGLLSPEALRILNQFFSMQQWFSKIDLLVQIGVSRDTYLARSKINCPVARPARFNEEYFQILSGAYDDAKKLLGKIPEATRPEHLKYDSSVNLNSSGRIESDEYVLAESSKKFSAFALDIADKVIDEMLHKSIEKIAVVKKDWLGISSFDDEMDEPAVQRFAREVFGREVEGKSEDFFSGAWRRDIKARVEYIEREVAEKDPSVVQLVSAAYVINNNLFLVLKRSQSEKRAQLRGKLTLIVSGHVDYEDRGLSYGGKNEIENCLLREMSEELEYFDRPVIRPKFAFRMGDDEMGKRHLAIVYAVSTNSNRVQTTGLPGTGDFEGSVMWFNFSELQQKIADFDPWSARVIERLMVG